MVQTNETRIIGIRHRIKRTTAGEARPTQLAILIGDNISAIELETEQDELDWIRGVFPIKWRKVNAEDDVSRIQSHHLKLRKVKTEESLDGIPEHLIIRGKKETSVIDKIPEAYDGLRDGDTVAIAMGGAGDRFAFALSRRAENLHNAKVLRLPSFLLKDECGGDRERHAECLARLVVVKPEVFRPTTIHDRHLIVLREALRARTEAMRARIAVEQQFRQRFIGQIFCTETGGYPEGSIEILYDGLKANDEILDALERAEKKRERELVGILEQLAVYQGIFVPIEGCGPMIAARLIATIGDIRQFKSEAKLKAYCGVHVLEDGRAARKRAGEVANWAAEARQALYLLGDQFNRRPNSVWGIKLREYKEKVRTKHPLTLTVGSRLSELFRAIERFYLSEGVSIDPSAFNLKTADGLYEYFLAGRTQFLTNYWGEASDEAFELLGEVDQVKLRDFERQIEVLGNTSGGTVALYSPGHIHKMAVWKTLSKFVEKLYHKWSELEEEQEAFQLLKDLPIYKQFLSRIDGCTPIASARLIKAIGDVARFTDKEAFIKCCGIRTDSIPPVQKRSKDTPPDRNETRRALYYLGKLFKDRPDKVWGGKVAGHMTRLREQHPEPIQHEDGIWYDDVHLTRMAVRLTLAEFAGKLYDAWKSINTAAG